MESFHRGEVASAHIFYFFELDICGLSSRYFISCLPFCPVPDCARLCEKIPEPSGEDDFFSKPRRGPALHNPAGTGRPLQAEIKQRSLLFLYSPSLFSSPSCCGMRCLSSGSFFILSIKSEYSDLMEKLNTNKN